MTKLCINCNLPIRGLEAEGDRPICLTCLQSLTPHCSFDGGYYNPDSIIKMGVIRQTYEQSSSKASECDESVVNITAQNENLTDKQEEENL
jgi:hypothetical protein